MLRAEFVESLDTIDPEQWQALFPNPNPFTCFGYLLALEQSNSVGKGSGWLPQHWLLWRGDLLIAAAPIYVKLHSYGEYLFDWAWAEAYQRNGLNYYPKLVCAIPFTPATGPRLGYLPQESLQQITAIFTQSLQQRGQQISASNAQVLFCTEQHQHQLEQQQWLARRDIQFHWRNRGYRCFDDFLDKLLPRKRKNINKERVKVAQAALKIRVLTGADIDQSMWQRFYHCYHTTYLKRSNRPGYLSLSFFQQLGKTMPAQVVMFGAFDGDTDQLMAAALCLRDNHTLYGRYWGTLVEQPGLHFELCYYQGIEYCIQYGIERFDPGAQGEHKIARGFEPSWIYGASLLFESPFADAIVDFCRQEEQLLIERMGQLQAQSPFKLKSNID